MLEGSGTPRGRASSPELGVPAPRAGADGGPRHRPPAFFSNPPAAPREGAGHHPARNPAPAERAQPLNRDALSPRPSRPRQLEYPDQPSRAAEPLEPTDATDGPKQT